jgi:hypothetical protein
MLTYGPKHELGDARMFVIEGTEKVRRIIKENRKLTKHKKLSNTTLLEIDNYSPLEIVKLQKNLMPFAAAEEIRFVHGKRKLQFQQLYEELEDRGRHLMGYKECF